MRPMCLIRSIESTPTEDVHFLAQVAAMNQSNASSGNAEQTFDEKDLVSYLSDGEDSCEEQGQ